MQKLHLPSLNKNAPLQQPGGEITTQDSAGTTTTVPKQQHNINPTRKLTTNPIRLAPTPHYTLLKIAAQPSQRLQPSQRIPIDYKQIMINYHKMAAAAYVQGAFLDASTEMLCRSL